MIDFSEESLILKLLLNFSISEWKPKQKVGWIVAVLVPMLPHGVLLGLMR